MRPTSSLLALACAGLLLPVTPAAAQRHTLDSLGFLPDDFASRANGINASGQVVGISISSAGRQRAFLWESGTGMQDILGSIGGADSYAQGINASGQVVGVAKTAGPYERAFLWSSGGGMQPLGTLGGEWSTANAINARGQVVGSSLTQPILGSGSEHAFVWDNTGGMRDLRTLGGSTSVAQAINASGQVAGYSQAFIGAEPHAFVWSDGAGMQDLGFGGRYSTARGINDSGFVVGNSSTATGAVHAFLWPNGGAIQDLGILPGGTTSIATAINATAQVVGSSTTGASSVGHAFVWNAGTMYDLDALLPRSSAWVLREATGINDLAQIAGYGVHNGKTEAFRLTLHPDWQGGNGSWSSAASWSYAGMGSFGFTPGAVHDVAISPAGSATVFGPYSATVRSLALSGRDGNLVTLNLAGGSVAASQGTTLGANGVVSGSGRLAGALLIRDKGRVLVGSGERMQLAGAVTLERGARIDALAISDRADLAIGAALTNAAGASVNLNNADLYASGGIVNGGRVSLTGYSTVAGSVDVLAGGQVNVSGVAAQAVFWDDLRNNGSVMVTPGSTATFFGRVSGGGAFLGGGTKYYAGGLTPGNSPALMTIEGPVELAGGVVTMELGGLLAGSEYDKVVFDGPVTLSGATLAVVYWDDWTAAAGQSYDLFDWGLGVTGTFDDVTLPALARGLAWDISALYASGEISVTAVPEPATYLLLCAGLGVIGRRAVRRRA